MIPENYRINTFQLFGRSLTVAGMREAKTSETFRYLKVNENRTVVIGLRETSDELAAKTIGLEYHHIPIEDYATEPLSPAVYDEIYSIVKNATKFGKQAVIHCRSGNGRTGVALATLKLRELLEEAAQKDLSILDSTPEKTASVLLKQIVPYPCTPFVKSAVEAIRTNKKTLSSDPRAGKYAVETENDVETLIAYEAHLLAVIKERHLKLKEESACPEVEDNKPADLSL